jgi:PhnB protein
VTNAMRPVPEGYQTVTPILTFDSAARAIEWYRDALDAEELSRDTGPDGTILHAELRLGSSRLMVRDVITAHTTPNALGGSPVTFWVCVEHCDALFSRHAWKI